MSPFITPTRGFNIVPKDMDVETVRERVFM